MILIYFSLKVNMFQKEIYVNFNVQNQRASASFFFLIAKLSPFSSKVRIISSANACVIVFFLLNALSDEP